jgi:hypothetical protein
MLNDEDQNKTTTTHLHFIDLFHATNGPNGSATEQTAAVHFFITVIELNQ